MKQSVGLTFSLSEYMPRILAVLFFILQIATAWNYGIFRDEMYFLDCGNHLAFGYVDHPPMVALAARIGSSVFGNSILAVRLIPAFAGAALVLIMAAMARRLGGGTFAAGIAALAMFTAPAFLGIFSQLNIPLFEILIWAVCACLFIDILNGRGTRHWLWLGLFAGLGLQTKLTGLVFGFALAVGLLTTRQRQQFKTPGPYFAAVIAGLVFLPNLVWQLVHDWPTLEFIANAQGGKIVELSPFEFISQVALTLNPVTIPLWLGGLIWLLLGGGSEKYRALAVFFIIALATFIFQNSKNYYIYPAYPPLFAAGAVALEHLVEKQRWQWLKPVSVASLVLFACVFAPLALPILQPDSYLAYTKALGIEQIQSENHEKVALPQHLADRFGWQELAVAVAGVYDNLPPEDRDKCAILMGNYGEAGAISYFGEELGLPLPICGHNSHWIWGPREYAGEVVIAFGIPEDSLREAFETVEPAVLITHPYVMAYENNRHVFVCRNSTLPMAELWPHAKTYN